MSKGKKTTTTKQAANAVKRQGKTGTSNSNAAKQLEKVMGDQKSSPKDRLEPKQKN